MNLYDVQYNTYNTHSQVYKERKLSVEWYLYSETHNTVEHKDDIIVIFYVIRCYKANSFTLVPD